MAWALPIRALFGANFGLFKVFLGPKEGLMYGAQGSCWMQNGLILGLILAF